MLKFSKIFILLIILMLLCSVTVFATEIDMNLQADTDEENTVEINTTDDDTTTNDTLPASTSSDDDLSGSAAPSSVSSIAQENMSFSNILNILVITVGVIIILLAIAILIRLK